MHDSLATRRTRQVITNIHEVKIAGVWVSLDLLEAILETDIYGSYINLTPGSQREALLEAGLIEMTTGLSYCASERLRTMVADDTGKYLADRYYKGFDDAPVIKPEVNV